MMVMLLLATALATPDAGSVHSSLSRMFESEQPFEWRDAGLDTTPLRLRAGTPERRELAAAVPLEVQYLRINEPLKRWLQRTKPEDAFDANARFEPFELARVGGVTVFAQGHMVGVDTALGQLVRWSSNLGIYHLTAQPLPGAQAGLLICTERDCSGDGYTCAKAQLLEFSRFCFWFAPQCVGSPAVDLSARFDRISVEGGVVTAEVFEGSAPRCTPTDGPEPVWETEPQRVGSWGPSGLLRGVLQTHRCAPPTWSRTVGHFASYEDGDDMPLDPVYGRLMPMSVPKCR